MVQPLRPIQELPRLTSRVLVDWSAFSFCIVRASHQRSNTTTGTEEARSSRSVTRERLLQDMCVSQAESSTCGDRAKVFLYYLPRTFRREGRLETT